ncbi:MAG: tetratricopeptide repeat protein [Alphaproteobacteria bacterium]|jgi:tetratricopeptide (TPR) repeat protein|nr:tetratricopeptide repeat protein [Alphaproteobacteria bacterium]MBT4711851.1 tetratricopeptide repeat protein [Alphaproteobacteria bacterium]MBT5859707.1 tetratricopeptide repeat protein [Alphaproteobacteria bacterium]
MTRTVALMALMIAVFVGGYFATTRDQAGPPEQLAQQSAIVADVPATTEWDITMAAGNAALADGNVGEAGRQFSLAIALTQGQPPYPKMSLALSGLGAVYRDQNRLAESEETYVRALAITEDAVGLIHADVATVLMGLAKTVYWRARDVEAEHLYDRALDIRMEVFGEIHLSVAESLEALGDVYQANAMEVDGDVVFWEAAEIRRKLAERQAP